MRRAVYGILCAAALVASAWYFFEIRRLEAPSRLRREKALQSQLSLGSTVDLSGLQDLTGKPIDVGSFRRKVVILELWATWCEPCVEGMPEVEKAFRALSTDPGIDLLAVNVGHGDSRDRAAAMVKARNWSLPVAFDGSGKLFQAIAASSIPTSGIVDGEGRLCARVEGIPRRHGAYEAELRKLIRRCRSGVE